MNSKCLAIVTFFVLFSSLARGQSLGGYIKHPKIKTDIRVYNTDETQRVEMSGNIFSLEAFKIMGFLEATLDRGSNLKISLDSLGGSVVSAMLIWSYLKTHCLGESECEVVTEVESGNECTSACIYIFMAGDERLAAPDSRFGFHSSRLQMFSDRIVLKVPTKGVSLPMVGVSKEWQTKNKSMFESIEDFTIFSGCELDGSNILTQESPDCEN